MEVKKTGCSSIFKSNVLSFTTGLHLHLRCFFCLCVCFCLCMCVFCCFLKLFWTSRLFFRARSITAGVMTFVTFTAVTYFVCHNFHLIGFLFAYCSKVYTQHLKLNLPIFAFWLYLFLIFNCFSVIKRK